MSTFYSSGGDFPAAAAAGDDLFDDWGPLLPPLLQEAVDARLAEEEEAGRARRAGAAARNFGAGDAALDAWIAEASREVSKAAVAVAAAAAAAGGGAAAAVVAAAHAAVAA